MKKLLQLRKSNIYMKIKIYLAVLFCAFQSMLHAQADSGSVDFLRNSGKIYTVVIVVVLIFLGIAFFLFRLDKKINKLENQIQHGSKTS